MSTRAIGFSLISLCLILPTRAAPAQPRPAERANPLPIKKTIVDFEIMMSPTSNPLDPQRWGPVFERLGVSVRFRQRILDDEPAVTERVRGSYRLVKAVGLLGNRGEILFTGGHTFTLDKTESLADWIGELQTYGAQGSPDGQPVWGLTNEQFEKLFNELSRPVAADVQGLEFEAAIKALGLPDAYPFRLHEAARETLQSADGVARRPLRHEVSGLSRGTALAIVLADYGLGYRPLRTPGGAINLVAEPLDSLSKPWPIGWPLEDRRPRNQTAPALFEQITAGFDDKPLADVLAAIEEASGARIIVDYERCAQKEIDPATKSVSYRQGNTAWILIIRSVTGQARLTREIMLDEAGTAFVHVYPFDPKRRRDRKTR